MVVMSIFLLLFVLTVGILYFRLHALPERIAGSTEKIAGIQRSESAEQMPPDTITTIRQTDVLDDVAPKAKGPAKKLQSV